MKEDKMNFSFLEKAFIAVAWFMAIIVGYFVPVSTVLKPIIVVTVFASLLASWMFLEYIIQEKKMGWRDAWGIFIFIFTIFFLWLGYSREIVSGHKILSAMMGGGFAVFMIVRIEPMIEFIFERSEL